MTDPTTIAVMAFGGIFALAGLVLMFMGKSTGRNTAKVLGAEFELSTPALVVFLVGAAMLALPLVMRHYERTPLPVVASPQGSPAAPRPAATTDTVKPLVTIRFDQPNVPYETPLFQAVRAALDQRPNASFEIVPIPATGSTSTEQADNAKRVWNYADAVMRSLVTMGLPANRVGLRPQPNQTASTDEVRIYLR